VAPLAVCVAVSLVTAAAAADSTGIFTLNFSQLVVLFPAYAAGAYLPRNRSLFGLAVCVAGMEAGVAAAQTGAFWAAFVVMMATSAWAVGRMIASRRGLAASLARTKTILDHERRLFEHLALADERQRIARDLQAIVVHYLHVMTDHGRTAQILLGVDTTRAQETITAIELAGHSALAEMRRLLQLLRDETDEAPLAPQPGVGQLRSLIAQARQRGWEVTFQLDGKPRPIEAAVDLATYRVVECVFAYNPPSDGRPVGVLLSFDDNSLRVQISGAPTDLTRLAPGLQERIKLARGRIEDSNVHDAGWLTVHLPIRRPAPSMSITPRSARAPSVAG
jgi:signal transduction histidine kinase